MHAPSRPRSPPRARAHIIEDLKFSDGSLPRELIPKFNTPALGIATNSVKKRNAANYAARQRASELAGWRAYAQLRYAEAKREADEMDRLQREDARARREAKAKAKRDARDALLLQQRSNNAAVAIQSSFRGRNARAEAQQLASARTISLSRSVWDGEGTALANIDADDEVAAALASAARAHAGASMWDGEEVDRGRVGDLADAGAAQGWYSVDQPPKWQASGERWFKLPEGWERGAVAEVQQAGGHGARFHGIGGGGGGGHSGQTAASSTTSAPSPRTSTRTSTYEATRRLEAMRRRGRPAASVAPRSGGAEARQSTDEATRRLLSRPTPPPSRGSSAPGGPATGAFVTVSSASRASSPPRSPRAERPISPRTSFGSAARWPAADREVRVGPGSYSPRGGSPSKDPRTGLRCGVY